ncbi:uncharacterized protein LOC144711349 [Wolffia australiana]
MSGVSLAGGEKPSRAAAPGEAAGGLLMGSLRVIELQLVAFIAVFSASGLVPLVDLAFPVFVSAYLLALSRWVFPAPAGPARELIRLGRGPRLYAAAGTAIGLFLPLGFVLGGFARGDEQAVRSAAPHLFLLSAQILTENVVAGFARFSAPVRALVPLLYTVRRVFVLLDWVSRLWLRRPVPFPLKDAAWAWFGRGLAAANLAYFSVNLFAFLIPRFLPRAFETYFADRENKAR